MCKICKELLPFNNKTKKQRKKPPQKTKTTIRKNTQKVK